eukprot:gene11369-4537_t
MDLVKNSQIHCFDVIGKFYDCLQEKLDINDCKNELHKQSYCIADFMTSEVLDPQLRLQIHHSIVKSTEQVNFQYKIEEKNKKLISNCGKFSLRYRQCDNFLLFSNEKVGQKCRENLKEYLTCCGKIFEKEKSKVDSFQLCWKNNLENFEPKSEEEFWNQYEKCSDLGKELTKN